MTEPSADPTAGTAPTCVRHPDRVSYVRCQRCGRPACPACQVPAPVGVHCVDCVAEARRTAPRMHTAFGAPVRRGRPVVTLTILALSVASYLLQWVVGDAWTFLLAFQPVAAYYEPHRFLTAAFLHSPSVIFHLLFNMYALWLTGPFLEQQLGRWRFTALYLLSAIAGSTGFLLLASGRDWITWVFGASGAVFGLFGAVFVVLRRVGGNARPILLLLVVNGVIGFFARGIAWEAHLGGLVMGALLALGYARAPRGNRTVVSVLVTVGAALLLTAASVIRYLTV